MRLVVGGALPLFHYRRTVHAVDGTTYAVSAVWLRRGFTLTYDSPKTPRAVRRAREAEMARVRAAVAADLARMAVDTEEAKP